MSKKNGRAHKKSVERARRSEQFKRDKQTKRHAKAARRAHEHFKASTNALREALRTSETGPETPEAPLVLGTAANAAETGQEVTINLSEEGFNHLVREDLRATLEGETVPELMKMAKEAGFKGYSKLKKGELVDLLVRA